MLANRLPAVHPFILQLDSAATSVIAQCWRTHRTMNKNTYIAALLDPPPVFRIPFRERGTGILHLTPECSINARMLGQMLRRAPQMH